MAEEEMNKTPNAQLSTSNAERSEDPTLGNGRSAINGWRVFWRILDFVLAAVFVSAGALKAVDPVGLAHDVDHFKILPWTVGVALAFYLPWLEILCGFGLVFRFLYRGALSILTALILIFTLAIVAAKVRGLDITCGCFGHASQHWSFPSHIATNLAILIALLVLSFRVGFQHNRQTAV